MPTYSHKHPSGIALVATILIMAIVLGIGLALVTLVRNNGASILGFSESQRAEELALFGIETVVLSLTNDPNWSNNNGVQNGSYLNGTFSVQLSSGVTDSITLVSTGVVNGRQYTLSKHITRPVTMATDVSLNSGSIYFSDSFTRINDVKITNESNESISIVSAIVTWDPVSPTDRVRGVTIGGKDLWMHDNQGEPDGTQLSGTQLIFGAPYDLGAGSTDIPLMLDFGQSMMSKTVSLVLQLSDGSSVVKTMKLESTDAMMLDVDTDTTTLGAANKEVSIDMMNMTSTKQLTVAQIKITWLYNDPVRLLDRVRFDNSNVWSGSASSGSTVTLSAPNNRIVAGGSKTLRLRFGAAMNDSYIAIEFTMSDGSKKTSVVDFRINQSAYLAIDTTSAIISGSNLLNILLRNTHPSSKIWVDSINISLIPDTGKTVESIKLDGVSLFGALNEPDDTGVTLSVTRTEIETTNTDHDIAFSSTLGLSNFVIVYGMRDGTSKTVTVDRNDSAADVMAGSTWNMYIDNGLTDVIGLLVSKNGTTPVTIEKMTVSWSPVGTIKLKKIFIDGATLYNNTSGATSGTQVTLTSAKTLSASNSQVDLEFTTTSVADRDVTTTFTLSDGTSKSFTTYFSPTNSLVWLAADSFEGGLKQTSGTGFASSWVLTDTIDQTFRTGSNSYSGNQHMRLRQSHSVTRTLTNSATTSQIKVTYGILLGGYDNGEIAYFETRTNSGSWVTVRSFSRPELANGTFYKYTNTLTPTIGQKFEFRFRGGANSSSEYIHVDELFFAR